MYFSMRLCWLALCIFVEKLPDSERGKWKRGACLCDPNNRNRLKLLLLSNAA